MRGRPRKILENEDDPKRLRRAQVREAQRKFRNRKEQSISTLGEKLGYFEDVIEEMSKTFLQFGTDLLDSGILTEHDRLKKSLKISTKGFLDLAERVHRIANDEAVVLRQPQSDSLHGTNDDHDAARQQQTSLPANGIEPTILSQDEPYTFQIFDSITKPQRSSRFEPLQSQGQSSRLAIIQMPTFNPLLASDYPDFESGQVSNQSFWRQLIRACLTSSLRALRDARHLHPSNTYRSKSWLARSHQFSLRHASISTLLLLTYTALGTITLQDQQVHFSTSEIPIGPILAASEFSEQKAIYFESTEQLNLGKAVRRDMLTSGLVLGDILDAGAVEDYLRALRMVQLSDQEMQLEVLVEPGKTQIVIIDVMRLIDSLVSSSVCLGDGIGFPKTMLIPAIVTSAVRMHHP